MSFIGNTVVGGVATFNPQFLPEYLIIGSLANVTGNTAPTSLSVTIDGSERINIPTAALVRAYGALGAVTAGHSTGTRNIAVYKIADGGAGSRNIQIKISQGTGGTVQAVHGFTTKKNTGVCFTANTQTIVANSKLEFDRFEHLYSDGALRSVDVQFSNGWSELLEEIEHRAVASMQRIPETDALTFGGLANYFDNSAGLYSKITLYTDGTQRTILRIGREVL